MLNCDYIIIIIAVSNMLDYDYIFIFKVVTLHIITILQKLVF